MGLSTNQPPTQVEHSGSSNSGEISPAAPPPTKMQPQNQQQSTNKLNCPRCDSRNTKFCYYNNYNKSQPRHFCKSCRRYWTAGGTLRNIPVGGGRKNKRQKPPPAAATKASKKISDSSFECINKLTQMESQAQNPTKRLISLGFGLDDENGTYINGGIGGSNNFPPPHTHNDELQFPCSISASGYFPDLYGCCSNGESCALEETAMTDVGPSLGLSSLNEQPWKYMESINSSWVWDDIDKLVSSDFSLPWDDAESN